MNQQFASVILEVSVLKSLDYAIPEALAGQVCRGMAVEVPLRGHPARGYVIDIKESSHVSHPLPIIRPLSRGPALSDELFSLALFMAKYYICPLGRIIKTMLPAGVRKNTAAKTQYYVLRAITREEMRARCSEMRSSAPASADVLDVMLHVKKGILHSELCEKAGSSPGVVKSLVEKGILSLSLVRAGADLLEGHEFFKTKPKPLREEQARALSKIVSSLEANTFATHLLFGITGSGKTEVYLQAIEKALELKKGIIMLVPEISLTEQTIERARARFAVPLAILHHRLSDGERAEAWEKIARGEIPISIGARSAIFSPVPNLGLIIVDEEHESSYKQSEESPTYQARDLAIMRGRQNNATVILGSATPSLESYYHASSGKYVLSCLKERGAAARSHHSRYASGIRKGRSHILRASSYQNPGAQKACRADDIISQQAWFSYTTLLPKLYPHSRLPPLQHQTHLPSKEQYYPLPYLWTRR
jgi:primosomal protein N' (replication factor Y)